MKIDRRNTAKLLADYDEYCEAKRDVDEAPLDFDLWLEMEAIAYAEGSA